MKPRYIIGAVVAIAFAVIGFSMINRTGIQYTDLNTAEELKTKVQVKGKWIKDEGASYDSKANIFRFTMEDDNHRRVNVVYNGAKPNNFELAESVVVKGKLDGTEFHASEIKTKCPSKYEGSDAMTPQKEQQGS